MTTSGFHDDFKDSLGALVHEASTALAIEADLSPPEVDREDIDRRLQVAEIRSFDGEDVTIEQLQADGTQAVVPESRSLPVKADD